MKASLKLNVKYSGEDANKNVVRALLEDIVHTCLNRGLMTGDYDLEVDEFSHEISFPPPSRKEAIQSVLAILRESGEDLLALELEEMI